MIQRRRTILAGMLAMFASRLALAQNAPKLIVLGAGITSPLFNINPSAPKREWSLQNWLVCNAAEADRTVYAELFAQIADHSGPGNGVTTFNLPSFPLQMKGEDPVSGMAICPFTQSGLPAGALMPFNISSNI